MNYFEYLNQVNGIELNEQQIKAASFDYGNALVLSTAGSGKTTVIIARTGRLLYEKKCSRKILTITFSKMAATDMKNRFQKYFKEQYRNNTEFSTIHSFAYKIVRDFFRKKGIKFEILKNNYQILGDILKSHYSQSYFNYVSDEEIENLSATIGYVNNMMIDPKDYKDFGIEIKEFDKLFEKYSIFKSQNKLIDFDDMLLYAYKIISGSKKYRDSIRNSYQYVQIDEMQDTSKIQHEIIKLISNDNLFMVGDDDQAIYSFRGSYPDFMLEFKNFYKEGKIFYLDNNFRSDKNIVETAKQFIEKNKKRFQKSIHTDNLKENAINLKRLSNRKDQAKLITNEITKYDNGTIGILYRYNMSSMILANSLYENNINFYVKEDKTKFFNSFVLNDVVAFLNLALNPKDRESFSRIYYKSYTYFTKGMCQLVINSPREDLSVFDILDNCTDFEYYVYDRISQFKTDINYINKLKPNDAIRFIKMDLEYMGYLERMQEEGRNNLSNAMHILEIMEEIGSYCSNIKEFINKIYSLQDVIKKSSENKNARVTLSTIHGAKGLEYDYVYMIDNLDDEFPSDKKGMQSEIYGKMLEEERRVFYVGMTRAKKILNITIPGVPSLFVNELMRPNKPHIEYNLKVGQKINHNKFGKGVIIEVTKEIVFIKFVNGNSRSFDIKTILENDIIQII
jgi:DNA helicase-2/ATP-dependent DNA helicase PcrA